MKNYQILNYSSGEIIFEGTYGSFKSCLEHAVACDTNLDYADLRKQNLLGANLDDGSFRNALFDESNLLDANLSEARLTGAGFTNCRLQNACFCFSDLSSVNFNGAAFGATDIAGATIDNIAFSTLSCFGLNFRDAAPIKNKCYYGTHDGRFPFARTPVFINGLDLPVVMLDTHLLIGNTVKTYEDWAQIVAANRKYSPDKTENIESRLRTFIKQHYASLIEIMKLNVDGASLPLAESSA